MDFRLTEVDTKLLRIYKGKKHRMPFLKTDSRHLNTL